PGELLQCLETELVAAGSARCPGVGRERRRALWHHRLVARLESHRWPERRAAHHRCDQRQPHAIDESIDPELGYGTAGSLQNTRSLPAEDRLLERALLRSPGRSFEGRAD